ncbi:MAG: hypothetical protein GX442_18765 [Candidatus Riflebacteria bacterium]|nr:hypothetical protein [Candidatus Riflebacteria bacterium]
MKRALVLALILSAAVLGPVMAFELRGYKIDPNDHVLISLLTMVASDLEMCGRSLQPSIRDEISALGHLNNAQSALKKANLDPAYLPLIEEILDRTGKIKFYLLMQDFNGVTMRLSQLIGLIRNLLGVTTGQTTTYGFGSGYNGGTFGTGGTNFTPTPIKPPEIPVGAPGGGSQIPVPSVGAPGVPVN